MGLTKAIVFDLGKVIFNLSFDRTFEYWAMASEESFNTIKNKFVFDEIFEKFERNEISPKEFREIIQNRLGIKLSDDEFDKGWCNLYMNLYADVESLLLNLKSKYRIVALTNTNVIHELVWKEKYKDVLILFEKVFSSPDLGTRKPESRIYEIVLEYLKLKTNEIIFFDDNIENINGAIEFGIPSILVTTYDQMKIDISNLV